MRLVWTKRRVAPAKPTAACTPPGRVLWFVFIYPRLGVAQMGAICLGVVVVDFSGFFAEGDRALRKRIRSDLKLWGEKDPNGPAPISRRASIR